MTKFLVAFALISSATLCAQDARPQPPNKPVFHKERLFQKEVNVYCEHCNKGHTHVTKEVKTHRHFSIASRFRNRQHSVDRIRRFSR